MRDSTLRIVIALVVGVFSLCLLGLSVLTEALLLYVFVR